MKKIYVVDLTKEEKGKLLELVGKGELRARKLNPAHVVLLLANEGRTDKDIARALHTAARPPSNGRASVSWKVGWSAPSTSRRVLAASASSMATRRLIWWPWPAPTLPRAKSAGRDADARRQARRARGGRGDLRRDAQKGAEKRGIKPWVKKQWCIPELSAQFVSGAWRTSWSSMKNLTTRKGPPSALTNCPTNSFPKNASLCLPRVVVPCATTMSTNEKGRRGSRNLFVFFEPKASWRHIDIRERRTAIDFAEEMRKLVDEHYPEAEKIRVVLWTTSTPTP